MCERVPLPVDKMERYRRLEAVRQFLRAEQRRLWQYMDNLVVAEQIQDGEIRQLMESVVRERGYDPDKVVWWFNEQGKEIIIIEEEDEERKENA